jgi:hypothetical protein
MRISCWPGCSSTAAAARSGTGGAARSEPAARMRSCSSGGGTAAQQGDDGDQIGRGNGVAAHDQRPDAGGTPRRAATVGGGDWLAQLSVAGGARDPEMDAAARRPPAGHRWAARGRAATGGRARRREEPAADRSAASISPISTLSRLCSLK